MATLQKPRDPYRGAVESQPLKGSRPDIVHEPELRRLRRQLESAASSGGATVVVEGFSADLGVTELPLSFGLLEMGEGEPGVPVEFPMTLRFVAASVMGTTVGGTDWTLRLWKREDGGEEFSQVATFSVATQDSGGP